MAALAPLPLLTPDDPAACCPAAALGAGLGRPAVQLHEEIPIDPDLFVALKPDGSATLDLVIPALPCGACAFDVERVLMETPGVNSARLNMTTQRLSLAFVPGQARAADLVAKVAKLGYRLVPYDKAALDDSDAREDARLLSAMGIAGFAAMNIMIISVSVWAGLISDMGEGTREFFHWLAALIGLPATVIAGMPFYRSAWSALRRGAMNMDVPIAVAVIMAAVMSLVETIHGGALAYYDGAVTLLFLLLIGRYLDRRVRGRARGAAQNLLALRAQAATVISADGRHIAMPVKAVRPGMLVSVAAGERFPVDGTLLSPETEADTSLVTGETAPARIVAGGVVHAGTVNLGPPVEVRVTAADEGTLLAEIARLMAAAEQAKAKYVELADRVARAYAPLVHVLALITFAGWMLAGAEWRFAFLASVTVLIITCPCALAIAVPAVQVVAVSRLLKTGTLLKTADGLERLADIDTVVFDKTGTLTLGRLRIRNLDEIADQDLRRAAALAQKSKHPLARAVAAAVAPTETARGVTEIPGMGLEGEVGGQRLRLGSRAFTGAVGKDADGPEIWLAAEGRAPVQIRFSDELRPDAKATIARLTAMGLKVELLSGDRPGPVAAAARAAGIAQATPLCQPQDKIARLEALALSGAKVLMVGDGLNDAPALAAAHVSASFASGADISQAAADLVIQGDLLAPLTDALILSRTARARVRENIILSLVYNIGAVPLAVMGLATPLIAAVAMAASSLMVMGNALRFPRGQG